MWEKLQHRLSQVCLLRGHKAAASDTVCLHTFTTTKTETEEWEHKINFYPNSIYTNYYFVKHLCENNVYGDTWIQDNQKILFPRKAYQLSVKINMSMKIKKLKQQKMNQITSFSCTSGGDHKLKNHTSFQQQLRRVHLEKIPSLAEVWGNICSFSYNYFFAFMRNTASFTYWTVSFSKEALETLKFPSILLK